MSKLAPTSIKYIIKARIKAKGVIEKPDIIGAVFGQTEGLLGSDLDLRELQRTGRIGRIEVEVKTEKGKTEGTITIPSSLDSSETAIVAAALETIERIGPCTAEIKIEDVEDTRADKRRYVVDRSKEILSSLIDKGVPESSEIAEEIKEAVRASEVTTWEGLTCGPNLMDSEEVIIVEGRADVINLLKYGIRNAIAVEGTSMPPAIKKLAKEKNTTLFVDGDRGGQLIARELTSLADIDYIAVAPEGKEVEELTKKEVYKALREKVPAGQFIKEISGGKRKLPEKKKERKEEKPQRGRRASRQPGRSRERRDDRRSVSRVRLGARLSKEEKELYKKTLEDLVGTRAACIFDEKNQLLGKVPVSELGSTLKSMEKPYAIVMDGKVDADLNDIARRSGVKAIIGMEKDDFYSSITVLERKDLK